MSSKPEPAIWSHDIGQWIPCFDRCQLIIAWMFNIEGTRCKPRLQDLVLTLLRPPCCAMLLGAIHVYHVKRVAWVSISISMHACDPAPIVIWLRLTALWAAGALLIKICMYFQTCICVY